MNAGLNQHYKSSIIHRETKANTIAHIISICTIIYRYNEAYPYPVPSLPGLVNKFLPGD